MTSDGWTEAWRRFFGLSQDAKALKILYLLYAEENRHAAIFAEHAAAMQYPQFRAKLLQIAEREARHSEWIAEKIERLGGSLPVIRPIPLPDGNSWEFLLEDFNSETRCAEELLEQATRLEADFPDLADMLQRISEEEQKHRDEIREMLMRSDALSRRAA
jgi:rubrerythrin